MERLDYLDDDELDALAVAADAKVKPPTKVKGDGAASSKPRLLVDAVNPDHTVAQGDRVKK